MGLPPLRVSASLLGVLDYLMVAGYTGGLVLLGLFLSRRPFRPVDYFLASRKTRWPAIGLSLFASNMSSTALVGLAGGAYAMGISVYNYEWSANVVLVFFCVFLLPFVIRSQTYTMPEFLERRYDRRVRLYFALLTLFLNIFVDAAGVLYSGALVCQSVLRPWPLWLIVCALATAAGIYATSGGLRAVIYTEAVQAVVLLAGALMISINAFAYAGGWEHVMHSVPRAAISLIRPLGDPGVPWPGLLLGVPILGFYYWCTNQSIVQRVLSAENIDQARWGTLLTGLLKLPVLFLIVLPGTCALLLFPDLPRSDSVYPTLIARLLPRGLVGIVVAGFVASAMVSIASMLNSASTLITMDIVKQCRPDLADRNVVKIGRWSTMLMLGVAIAWAPQLQHFPSLWQYLQAVLAYAVPPVVSMFLLGLFWRGATPNAAAATMILGSLCGITLFIINAVLHWTHIHFLYVAPMLTIVDLIILVALSVLRPAPLADGRAQTMWHTNFGREEHARLKHVPVWQDYRFLSAALLCVTAVLVFAFR